MEVVNLFTFHISSILLYENDLPEMVNGRAAVEFTPGAGSTVIEACNQDFKESCLALDFLEEELKSFQRDGSE